jgi:Ca2+-binding RTX toxin-like protein
MDIVSISSIAAPEAESGAVVSRALAFTPLSGTTQANLITGRGGSDLVRAGGGDDTVNGYAGDDTIYGDDGSDKLLGSGGDDALHGGGGTKDALFGGWGDDTLVGGSGKDQLFGGYGADVFVFLKPSDSVPGGGAHTNYGHDIIKPETAGGDNGFEGAGRAGGDLIDLRGLGDLTWGGTLKIVDHPKTQHTYVEVDLDGNGKLDFELAIYDGEVRARSYTPNDFLLA